MYRRCIIVNVSPIFLQGVSMDLKDINIEAWNLPDTSEMETLACLLEAAYGKTSIVLDSNIALIGYGIDEKPKMPIYTNGFAENHVAFVGASDNIFGFRGNYFLPMDVDQCLLFDAYVNIVGIVHDKENEPIGYIFGLKDYRATNWFDDEVGVIYFDNKHLYSNNIDVESYKIDIKRKIADLSLKCTGNKQYKLTLNGNTYKSHVLTNNYDFYNFYIN
jgi:hypothetical protein